MGYSADQKAYTWYGIDNSGFGDGATGQLEGDTWIWNGEYTMGGQQVKMRSTLTQQSADAYTWRLEMSTAGGSWTTVGEGRDMRVK